ncbi:MAG: DNA-formamidopyrimidine glycosylase [Mycoplasmataceae bacterium]|jgi:formamidopyrimidine-DNA glycosylase|nr:DNA-formamidopyrimidine glycosylase [Mycoplasmataceae bacterium]
MPELPEVQTVINILNKSPAIDKKIIGTRVFIKKILKNTSVNKFDIFLKKEKIISFNRYGKYIIIKLTNNKNLFVHLRMEGKLFCTKDIDKTNVKHLCIQIMLENGFNLFYYDTRMFGTFHIFVGNSNDFYSIKSMGPDAMLSKKFNVDYLKNIFKHTKKNIKTIILDQTKISGIGNIYADEILFACKINPFSKANALDIKNIKNFISVTTSIFKKAILYKGTTIFSYMSSANHTGNYQKYLNVYGRNNEPCNICRKKIVYRKINGRGTYFCEKCQKLL